MQFVIVGGGSIGLLIGSFLAQQQANVTFWVRREEQAEQLNKRLLRLSDNSVDSVFRVQAVVDAEELPTDALWIIAVKFDDLHNVLQKISTLPKQPHLLFIQNGIGHVSIINQYKLGYISFATVEHGAQRVNDYTVRHNGVGSMIIAMNEKIAPYIEWLQAMELKDFPVLVQQDSEKLLLRKVLINCAINPLTAILQITNGQLLDNSSFHLLFKQVCKELLDSFPEVDDVLCYKDIENVCRKTANNQSSMLVDRLKGNAMEIETIVTSVLSRIYQRQRQAPMLQMLETMLIGLNRSEYNE
ncbi:hypothetical protein DV702_02125 [Sporosarcina sp. PTS2304]|uniref:2-dehydropantoate 2-reductase n=1 Tax=Sporosarcina sp. PTS2304 TaxID=2283194 RepID=UPI000E0D51C8|nr:2-dehydropantoate 2-reductase [Sporosarcina sp. PTS2304]AXH98615.1 hypothetical protein DV702_02125 [Sporosarcina sp. PTS2304]